VSDYDPIHIGEDVYLRGTFKNRDGDLVDPGVVVLWIEESDGTQTDYDYPEAVSRLSTGVYEMTFNPIMGGAHDAWFTSVGGSPQLIVHEKFYVVPDP
jgi:hypothetical protein